jgi:hypothetical protein
MSMTLNLPEDKLFLTEKEVAQLLRVAINSIRNIRNTGRLPFLRVGVGMGRIVNARADVEAFIESVRTAAISKAA